MLLIYYKLMLVLLLQILLKCVYIRYRIYQLVFDVNAN